MTRSRLCLSRISLAAVIAAWASVANADMLFYDGGGHVQPSENVMYHDGDTGTTLSGITNQTHTTVVFTQPSNPVTLVANGGQATISAASGTFTSLKIALAGGFYFNEFEADPVFTSGDLSFIVGAFDPTTQEFFQSFISGNGNSFFGVQATGTTLISYIEIQGPDDALQLVKQIRIGGVIAAEAPPPAPEPGTAALLAIGAIGFGGRLYRRRRRLG